MYLEIRSFISLPARRHGLSLKARRNTALECGAVTKRDFRAKPGGVIHTRNVTRASPETDERLTPLDGGGRKLDDFTIAVADETCIGSVTSRFSSFSGS